MIGDGCHNLKQTQTLCFSGSALGFGMATDGLVTQTKTVIFHITAQETHSFQSLIKRATT